MNQKERIAHLEAEVASQQAQIKKLTEALLNVARSLPSPPVVIQPVVDPVPQPQPWPQPWNPYPQPQPWVSPFQPLIAYDGIYANN